MFGLHQETIARAIRSSIAFVAPVALLVTPIMTITAMPPRAHGMVADHGLAYTLCATIDATITRIAPTPAGLVLTVYDTRLRHDRAIIMTPSSTLEDRQGNNLKASMVRTGDHLQMYVPGRYTTAQCALTPVPRVAFAQEASKHVAS